MTGLPNEKSERPLLSMWPLGFAASGAFYLASRGSFRAAYVALSSWMKPQNATHNVRIEDIDFLKRNLSLSDWGERHVAVTGPKGVGKTCLIDNALHRTMGVVRVPVYPGDSRKMIEEDIMRAVTNTPWKWADVEGSFRRVIFWHRVFTLGKSPIVVIDLKERKADEQHANIAGVVRELMQNYGLRVILDCSPSSLDPYVIRTGRFDELRVEPLSDEAIAEVQEFKQARKWLKEVELEVAALELFGGSPMDWSKFVKTSVSWKFSDIAPGRRKELIEDFLMDFYESRKFDMEQNMRRDQGARVVADLFVRSNECLPFSPDIERPDCDKIFRAVRRRRRTFLEPATRVLFYALKYGDQIDSIDRLKEITALEHARRYNHTGWNCCVYIKE